VSAAPASDRELLEQAVAELAHSLRTPLAAILGFAELLATRDSEQIRRVAPLRIQEAAEAMMRELDARLEQVLEAAADRVPDEQA
jgi:signal transduction histidine kinase